VICVLLALRRPLSPYYTLYLADNSLPFTAVIETTNLIDPALVGGHHLVYLPKYLGPDSELFQMPDDMVRLWFVAQLKRMYPDLTDDDIIAAPVFRAPHVEPLHPLGSFGSVPPTRTPITGLSVGSTKHFYPRLNNGDAVCSLGSELAAAVTAAHAKTGAAQASMG
jgi:protoporphyrinogen oxidase